MMPAAGGDDKATCVPGMGVTGIDARRLPALQAPQSPLSCRWRRGGAGAMGHRLGCALVRNELCLRARAEARGHKHCT
jgi:hypothetical protein